MNPELHLSNPELIASALELEFGCAQLCCYGLFPQAELENPEPANLLSAQARFSESLLQLLIMNREQDSHTLLVGATLAPLAAELADQDIRCSWLSREFQHEPPLAGREKLKVYPLDIFSFEEQIQFDCIVVAGSYKYLDQLGILSKCRDLLNADGTIILFGEFLDDDSAIEYSGLPNLSSFKHLSERLGFEIHTEVDYTESAEQSLKIIDLIVASNRQKLADGHGVSALDVEKLQQELTKIGTEFGNHRRCFRLFQLRLNPGHSDEYAQVRYDDMNSFEPNEISNLFRQSFDKEFDSAIWNWKYELGDGKCVVARIGKEGEIVAHYGGAPRHIIYFGTPSMAIQPCDVMVLPEKRSQYGKSSLFFRVAATFLEREIGNTVNQLLGFGFPNQKAMNIAIRLGLYEKTDDFVELVYADPAEQADQQRFKITALDLTEPGQQQELDKLWQQMCEGYSDGIIGVRNWQYIFYRYFEHPFAATNQYRCVVVSDVRAEQVYAVAVLKDHGQHTLLMDLICPIERMHRAISVLNQLVSESESSAGLKMWVTRGWLDKIKLDGATVNELGIEIPCNSWNPGPSAETLYGAWWLTAGDMDFV